MDTNKNIKKPNVIIAGTVKSGTTSLYTYLSWHPEICVSPVKEVNYFTPIIYNKPIDKSANYYANFKHCIDKKCILEASPRYIYGGKEIANRIIDLLGEIKIIIMLRNPTDRLFSFYNHMKRKGRTSSNVTFKQFVYRCSEELYDNNGNYNFIYKNIYTAAIIEAFYARYLEDWFDIFGSNIKVCFLDQLKDNPHYFMDTICDYIGVSNGQYNNSEFTIENKSIPFRSQYFSRFAHLVYSKAETFFRKNQNLKRIFKSCYHFLNKKNENYGGIAEVDNKTLEYIDQENKP